MCVYTAWSVTATATRLATTILGVGIPELVPPSPPPVLSRRICPLPRIKYAHRRFQVVTAGCMTATRTRNLSIFLIGDSIDRNAVSEICRAKAANTTTYIPEAVITKAMGMSGYWMCKFRAGTSYTIAHLMNYGVSKEGDHYLIITVHLQCNHVHHMTVQA